MTKGKKNEPRKIDLWNPDDLTFLDNRTKDLSFSSPYELERSLERLTESLKRSQTDPGLTPLEFILREFEDEAKKKLEENGLDSEELTELWRTLFDPEDFSSLCRSLEDDFPSLVSPLEPSMQLQNAAHVAFCVDRLRNDISKSDVEQTAIDMLKLCFAAVNVNLHEIIIRGIRAKTGPAKGGRTPKKEERFFLVARYALQNSKKKDTLSLWKYLKKVLPELERTGNNHFGNYEALFEAREYKGASEDVISIYKKNGKTKDIGFRGFQRYVSDLKKQSQ